jgi:Trypsin-like peptidase domain
MKRNFSVHRISLLVLVLCLMGSAGVAQDAVPREILERTLYIKVGVNVTGTAFKIDYNGKLYWVTARHVVAGLPMSDATIQVQQSGKWVDQKVVKILFPPSESADIAVLDVGESISQPFEIAVTGKADGVTFGQQVWFLGYPYGLGTDSNGLQFPFIKKGIMSALDSTNPDAIILYIDGFNNPGFSGGPIVYWAFGSHTYRILGVVQGYKVENAKMMVNGQPADTQVLVNSGILIGYSIAHAIQAIDPTYKP